MLTDKEIEKISKLARIKLTNKEVEGLKKDLSSILDYIEKLNSVNTDNIEPLYQTTGLINSERLDETRNEFKMSDDLNARLIEQAPQKENRFIKVKSVLNKNGK